MARQTRSSPARPTADRPVSELSEGEARAEIDRLAGAIRAADRAYYQDDAPEMSDADYDALRQRLSAIEGQFPELADGDSPSRTVGASPVSGFGKVRHLKPMLSLDNLFSEDAAARFIERVRRFLNLPEAEEIALTAEPKIDGLSVSLLY